MQVMLMSGDPGGSNFAYCCYDYDSDYEPALMLTRAAMVQNTVSTLGQDVNVKALADRFCHEMDKHLPEGVHLALERYIPRGMRQGVLSEVIPMMIGLLVPQAACVWLPQAAEWKGMVNRQLAPLGYKLGSKDKKKKNAYLLVSAEMRRRKLGKPLRDAATHLFDSSLIGLAYLEKELNIPTISKMTTLASWEEHIKCLCTAAAY